MFLRSFVFVTCDMQSCLVIDALGYESRERQIKQLLDAQLSSYDSVFAKDQEYSTLQHVERRYAWFKRYVLSCCWLHMQTHE